MENLEYKVIKTNRKTLAIEVKLDGTVIVRAPLFCTERKIKKSVREKCGWIEKSKLKMAKRRENISEPTEQEVALLKSLAKRILPEKTEYYSKLMGVTPTKITITSAKTRFGSCSSKNSVSFSYRLMSYPDAAIDYVVVHELAHIKHHNHSKEFYKEIEKILPDYKEREKFLRNR